MWNLFFSFSEETICMANKIKLYPIVISVKWVSSFYTHKHNLLSLSLTFHGKAEAPPFVGDKTKGLKILFSSLWSCRWFHQRRRWRGSTCFGQKPFGQLTFDQKPIGQHSVWWCSCGPVIESTFYHSICFLLYSVYLLTKCLLNDLVSSPTSWLFFSATRADLHKLLFYWLNGPVLEIVGNAYISADCLAYCKVREPIYRLLM